MRFIAHLSSSPILSLQKVQGIVSPAINSPFAHLDAVYTYMPEQVDDQEAVNAILASKLLVAELKNNNQTLLRIIPAKIFRRVSETPE